MSVIVNIFGSAASRSASRAQTRQAQELAILSTRAAHTRLYRILLVAFLISLISAALIEVVLIPGKLLRCHFGSTAAAIVADSQANAAVEPNFKLPFGLQTDEQKAKQKQDQLDLIQQRLHSAHEQLDQSYQKLLAANDSLESYCRGKLHVVPDVASGSIVPKGLVDVVANEPTAQLAWANLLQTEAHAGESLRGAHKLLDSVAVHFTGGSFLAEDEHDMNALLDGMHRSLFEVLGSRDCIDHIEILQRGRAALAHQPPAEDNPRNPP